MGDENGMDGVVIVLADCEATILAEIAHKGFKRLDIAKTYALSMRAERFGEKIDWGNVNAAIIARWSVSGLNWIKEQAWSGKCFAPRPAPPGRLASG